MAGDEALEGETRGGFDMRQLAGERYPPPAWHLEKIEQELAEPDKTRMMRVVARMGAQDAPDLSAIDWDRELERFHGIDFPSYYTQPFHSVPGGYLSEAAAMGDRAAMEAIYEDAHPRRSLGVRDAIAALVPADATTLVVFPHFDPAEVLELAGNGARLPAGITRHLIRWRALRINVPIADLEDVPSEIVHEVQEIVDAIKTYYNDDHLRIKMAMKSRERAAQYSWNRCSDETFSYLKNVYEEYEN